MRKCVRCGKKVEDLVVVENNFVCYECFAFLTVVNTDWAK